MSQNTREIWVRGDVIFKEKSIKPGDNKEFSKFYCQLVTQLRYEVYVQEDEEEVQLMVDELLEKADELETKINDNRIANTKKFIRDDIKS